MTVLRWAQRLLAGLAVCTLGGPLASAGVGFQPPTPDELKMTSEPLAPGAPASNEQVRPRARVTDVFVTPGDFLEEGASNRGPTFIAELAFFPGIVISVLD
jgi:hypothetical protein